MEQTNAWARIVRQSKQSKKVNITKGMSGVYGGKTLVGRR